MLGFKLKKQDYKQNVMFCFIINFNEGDSMKFAVFTDVHGNMDALATVLRDIDRRGDIDHIYNLGDIIGIGHNTNEVLGMVTSRDDITSIAGNHDEAIMSVINQTPYPEDLKDKFYEHHHWIAEHLNPQYYEYLNQLPRTFNLEVAGQKVLGIHYEIENMMLEQPIDKVPFSPIVEPTASHMAHLFKDKEADLILFSHNHTLHHFIYEDVAYFNPGSVGLNRAPYTVYGIVTITPEQFNIEHVRVAYDNTRFIDGFEQKDVPGQQLIFDKFIQ